MIVISAIASAALTGVASYFAQSWADEAARRDESKINEVTQFVDAGEEYRQQFSLFMQKFTQKQPFSKEREVLLSNLREQHALLDAAKQTLEDERYEFATSYQGKLSYSINQMAKPITLETSEPLVQSLMDVLDDEVCVAYYLRDEADLNVSQATAEQCPLP